MLQGSVTDWEQKYRQPPWKLYTKALCAAILVVGVLSLMSYANKKGWNDGVDDEGTEISHYDPAYDDMSFRQFLLENGWLQTAFVFVVLSCCVVYRRHSLPIGTVASLFSDPKTYIGMAIGALLMSYVNNHPLQYVSLDPLLDCYDSRIELWKTMLEWDARIQKYFEEGRKDTADISRDVSIRREEFRGLLEDQKKINTRGHAWMRRCFHVQFRFSADTQWRWRFYPLEEW
jgi:hypothetical protein